MRRAVVVAPESGGLRMLVPLMLAVLQWPLGHTQPAGQEHRRMLWPG